jgi:cytidylate kinase
MRRLIIAIDGPSSVGKGTVARRVASALGYRHIDTGAMYRAMAWFALQLAIGTADAAALEEAAERMALYLGDDGRVAVNGLDVTRAIRTPAIDRAASEVSRVPAVRRVLVRRQRALGQAGGVVMEGRDIGTVVFPGADVKIYLDAAPEERARRRAADPAHARPAAGSLADVAREIDARDQSDRTRHDSPLAAAPDAYVVDTTGVAVEDVVAQVLKLVRASGGRHGARHDSRSRQEGGGAA